MAMRNDLSAEIKSDLINYNGAVDGTAYLILGDTVRGDSPVRVYFYNSSSSATADNELVLAATGMGGTGRFLKAPIEQIPGGIIVWPTSSAPLGWLICNGAAISRTTYFNLFGIIGTTYGTGDGSTTFNIPDFRQRFPLGVAASGTGSTLAGTGGTVDHLHAVDPASTATSSDGSHNHTGVTGTPSATVAATNLTGSAASTTHTHTISSDGAHTHTVDIASFNSGTANPPYLAINFIIKT